MLFAKRGLWGVAPASALLLGLAVPAVAEVCDKVVGDHWIPADGPVWLPSIGAWMFWGVLAIYALGTQEPLAARAIGSCILVVNVFLSLGAMYDYVEAHEVIVAAVREGCRSPSADIANSAILFAVGLGFLALARAITKRNTALNRARSS
ncbi:MAG: hypothetical protein ABL904_18045 [Hyphomicrobiaceae bacterium]